MKITGQFNLLSYNINTELFSSIIKFGHKKVVHHISIVLFTVLSRTCLQSFSDMADNIGGFIHYRLHFMWYLSNRWEDRKETNLKMEEISIIWNKGKILNKPQELLMFLHVIFLQSVWKMWLACTLFSFFKPLLFLKRQNQSFRPLCCLHVCGPQHISTHWVAQLRVCFPTLSPEHGESSSLQNVYSKFYFKHRNRRNPEVNKFKSDVP